MQDYLALFIMFFCRQFLGIGLLLSVFPDKWRFPKWSIFSFYTLMIGIILYVLNKVTLAYLIPVLYLSAVPAIALFPFLLKIPLRFVTLFVLFLYHIGILIQTVALTVGTLYFQGTYFIWAFSAVSSILCLIAYFPLRQTLSRNLNLLLKTKATPLINFTNLILLLNFIGVIVTKNANVSFSWQLVSARFFNVVPTILFLAIVLYLLNQIEVNQTMNLQIDNLRKLHNAEKHYFDFVIDSWFNARKIRHDSRHMALLFLNYLNAGQYAQLHTALEKMLQKIEHHPHISLCNNEIIDGIAGYWNMQAINNNICFSAKINILDINVPDYDLAMLLGNTLENAFQAAKAQTKGAKFIDMKIVTKNESLLIVIRNSYDQQIVRKGDVFYSYKRDFQEPGIGLKSVRDIVQKLNGYLVFDVKDGVFTISLAINNEKSQQIGESL
ncbi:MAG: ATP-binding protein [Acidaminococcaceae bacterium]|nr:ATP-binding protein [Acidaminococcaceae bacterium]